VLVGYFNDYPKDADRQEMMQMMWCKAVASLIHAERLTEAAEIMVRYEKGSEHDAAYLYLDWKLEHKASEGKSLDVEDMLKAATKLNGHVRHLMTFKAKTIPYPRYKAIEPGTKTEPGIYGCC